MSGVMTGINKTTIVAVRRTILRDRTGMICLIKTYLFVSFEEDPGVIMDWNAVPLVVIAPPLTKKSPILDFELLCCSTTI